MKAAVFYNDSSIDATNIAIKVGDVLKKASVEAFYIKCPTDDSRFKTASIDEIYSIADFCVIVGGDGTIIRYAKSAALAGKTVIGINAGRLGYLADLESDELDKLVKICSGEYETEERMMLKVSVADAQNETKVNYCINDAVLIRGAQSHMIDFYVNIYGEKFEYRGDGMIFSTPTGSTGYSLSAGGPITSPDVKALIMTPICSHSLMSRPVIFGEKTVLTAGITEHYGCESYVCFDWDDRTKLTDNSVITVESAENTLKLIRINGSSFYNRLVNKFS